MRRRQHPTLLLYAGVRLKDGMEAAARARRSTYRAAGRPTPLWPRESEANRALYSSTKQGINADLAGDHRRPPRPDPAEFSFRDRPGRPWPPCSLAAPTRKVGESCLSRRSLANRPSRATTGRPAGPPTDYSVAVAFVPSNRSSAVPVDRRPSAMITRDGVGRPCGLSLSN